jgi:HEAT repeat protein
MCKPDSFKINAKLAPMIVLLIALSVTQSSASQAQSKNGSVTVTSVSAHMTANRTVVSIAADGTLNRAQTWQARDGYHVVVPSGGAANAMKVSNGIKVNQLERSLEIVIPTKAGASVTAQSKANHLNLNIEGQLDTAEVSTERARASADAKPLMDANSLEPSREPKQDENLSGSLGTAAQSGREVSVATDTENAPPPSGLIAQATSGDPAPVQGEKYEPGVYPGESGLISGTTVVILLGGLGCLGGLLVLRKRRSTHAVAMALDEDFAEGEFDDTDFPYHRSDVATKTAKTKGRQEKTGSNGSNGSNGSGAQRKSLARMPVAMPSALYGAYQVDQEIGKLVQGQTHRMDVVASRAPDDLRAIEASLLKTLVGADDEDLRRRARTALEEYGFVARQSAALLLAADPYERTSAARMLGDVKSAAALPFLLEALYDHESLVRNQAVLSIGELKLPSAIGALLDIARKHPDVPGSLLSRALSACSVEGLDFFDNPIPEPRLLGSVDAHLLAHEITKLEPASIVQELPETADDERLAGAFVQIESADVNERSDAMKTLAQFPVRTAVTALAKVARFDSEASMRALAISSLAFINHESVFPAILIGMADESREVRAAAARSLSRVSFDRADAYIRVTETDDLETLRDVAQACIKAGIAAQGIDRLSSGDHQAYEALAVVSLLVKANTFEPLLEAIAHHPNLDVRLTAIHLFGMAGQTGVLEELRQLEADCTSDVVKGALAETIAKLTGTESAEDTGLIEEASEVACADDAASQYEFATEPQGETEAQLEPELVAESECETEVQPDSNSDLDSSGLTPLSIA